MSFADVTPKRVWRERGKKEWKPGERPSVVRVFLGRGWGEFLRHTVIVLKSRGKSQREELRSQKEE